MIGSIPITYRNGTPISSIWKHVLVTKALTLFSPVTALCTTILNIQKFYLMTTEGINVFCMGLRTNAILPYTALFPGFYNRGGVRLLCGTNWIVRLIGVFKCLEEVLTKAVTYFSRVLLEKLTDLQLVKDISSLDESRRFNAFFTRTRPLFLSWVTTLRSTNLTLTLSFLVALCH